MTLDTGLLRSYFSSTLIRRESSYTITRERVTLYRYYYRRYPKINRLQLRYGGRNRPYDRGLGLDYNVRDPLGYRCLLT